MISIGVKGFKFSLGTFLSLWISLVAAETICTEVTEIPEDECNALVALEAVDETFSLGGKSPCSSSDITCEDGHVIEIRVGKLEGALPDLSALSFLRAINRVCEEEDYYEEEFYYCSSDSYYFYEYEECYDFGNLTALSDLSTLTHLTFLNLENNSLNGTLNISILPSSLQSLNLGFNDLEGPLPNLSNKLPNLTYIDLSGNTLDINGSHFPTSLESLQLKYADLKQLPDLSSLTHLTTLDITGNELSESIVGTSLPNSLMELYLNDTLFNQPLPDLSHLTHLTTLDISHNTLSEPISGTEVPGSLTKLSTNNLVLNQSFPDLSALNNITTLRLNDAKLRGPVIAADLPSNLTTLSLRNNPLNQSLPDLSALTQLTDLDLGNTQLSGSINPAFLPPSLEVLKLDNNALAGDIPDLSKLETLVSLNLENNPQLTWSDKTSLLPPSLESLYLNGTSLKQLPDLSNLDKLIYLELKNAQLSEVIDTHYFPTQLKWLYLSDNQLQGSLPDLSQLTELQGFFVFNNQLSGTINIAYFPEQLKYLSLHKNQLSGNLPDFTELQALKKLDLSFNQFTGIIPAFPTELTELYLNNNQFSGDVPLSLTQLTQLGRYYSSEKPTKFCYLENACGYCDDNHCDDCDYSLNLSNNALNVPASPEVSAFLEAPGNKDPNWAESQTFPLFTCPKGGSFGINPDPHNFDFGTEAVNQTTTLRLNTRAQDCETAQISDIIFSGTHAGEFAFKGDPQQHCYSSRWGEHHYTACQFTLTFTPKSSGLKEDTFLEFIFDPETETQPVPLKANAVSSGSPQIQIEPEQYDFGNNTREIQIFTLKNTGQVNLKTPNFTLTGAHPHSFSFDSWNCARQQIIPPSTEVGCELMMQFIASGEGDKKAALSIKSPHTTEVIVPIQGYQPKKCRGDEITIESAQSGSWNDAETWQPQSVPTNTDIVRINSHHMIIGVTDQITVNTLCIEADATLRSQNNQGKPLAIQARRLVNRGTIEGQDGADEMAQATACDGDYPTVIGAPGCAQPGASLILSIAESIENKGIIIAGNGGQGNLHHAYGGNVSIQGETIINNASEDRCGTIKAGDGGGILANNMLQKQSDIAAICIDYTSRDNTITQDDNTATDAQTAQAGQGGDLTLIASGYFYNYGAVQVLAGNGGNCNPEQTRGGDGGDLRINAFRSVNLTRGYFKAGQGSTDCQQNGKNGNVFIDPSVISLAGANTIIEGDNITIFGGEHWILDLSHLEETQLSAQGDINLAVGKQGIIDLSHNTNTPLTAQGQVNLFSDELLLAGTASLEQVINATNIAIAPSRIFYDVAWLDANKVVGEPGDIISVQLTLANNGPSVDRYQLSVGVPQELVISKIPAMSAPINALEIWTVEFTVTLPDNPSATHLITITATSQANEQVKAVARIPVVVDQLTTTIDLPELCPQKTSHIEEACNNFEQTLTDITLGPKANITGGHLSGEIQGHSIAKAILKDLTLEPNTQVNNVIIGKTVHWDETVQWGEGVVFQICDIQRLSEQLPLLPKLSDQECVQFNGGIAIAETDFEQQLTVTLSDTVTVQGHIAVAPQDWYQSADIVVYATYRPLNTKDTPANYFMLDAQGQVLPWDTQPAHLVAFKTQVPLAKIITVPLYQGAFLAPGQLEIYFGYQLPTGVVKTNGVPIKVSITH